MNDRRDYSGFEHIQVVEEGPLHRLTLNRPQQANAIGLTMASELRSYFDRLYEDLAVRVVILEGAGPHFCAGLDLADLDTIVAAGADPAAAFQLQRAYADIILKMRRCPQPIIALVHGAASGGGLALALAADVRFAADDVRMNVAMARLGLTGCDVGISYFLPRIVGASNAAEMMMGGRFVDAHKALRIGLVCEVVTRQSLQALGAAMASDMLAMSPVGLRMTKQGLKASIEGGSLESIMALEDRGQVLCIAPYLQEGARAFLEKRPAVYE